MSSLRAAARLAAMAVVLVAGTLAILVVGWMPLRIRGVRLGAWPTRWLARAFLRLFGVRLTAPTANAIRTHHGFVFCNHQSYLDVAVLVSLWPTRFLATSEVRRYPLIGWIAAAVGTVFVDRGDRASRQRAREQLLRARRYPPIVIFPEGGIPADGGLQPLRHGAFELAAQSETPVLPCVIIYEPAAPVRWGDESLPAALWRLGRYDGTVTAKLVVLPPMRPGPADSPAQLALQLHETMRRALEPGAAEQPETNLHD